jgi:hypothetical protein
VILLLRPCRSLGEQANSRSDLLSFPLIEEELIRGRGPNLCRYRLSAVLTLNMTVGKKEHNQRLICRPTQTKNVLSPMTMRVGDHPAMGGFLTGGQVILKEDRDVDDLSIPEVESQNGLPSNVEVAGFSGFHQSSKRGGRIIVNGSYS